MLTREEWDMIARCVHCHPPSITTEQANNLIQKLSETVKELDIDYHFEGNHSHYQIVADLITSAECKQAIDQVLMQRRQIIKELRYKQEKLFAELRRKEEEREAQLKKEMDEAIAEKRKVA